MSVKRKVTVPDGSPRDTVPHDRRSGGVTKGRSFRGPLRQSGSQTSRSAVDKPDRQPARPSTSLPGQPRSLGGYGVGRMSGTEHLRVQAFCKHFGFRGDVTLSRLNADAVRLSGLDSAFRWNTAERAYTIEAAHNPEVAGSNPAPATEKGPGNRAFSFGSPALCPSLQAFDTPSPRPA